ncbi:MAG: glycerophosphodiester phosphodiesterase [Actinomycetota bacterium]|nr:glycerophosphodiester phosphodiesterase [Actinomycetota bacterium]
MTADPHAPPATGFPYLDAMLDRPGAKLAMAHRGGAGHPSLTGVENSLFAFQHAVALGYRYLETDVHASKDGVLYSCHDEALDRVTGYKGRIPQLTSAQVDSARIGGTHVVPTMASLFEALPECRFNIDIKTASAIEPLAALVRSTGAQDRVLVASFSRASLNRFRRLTDGLVATSAAPAEVALFMLAPTGELARRLTGDRVAALQVPPYRHGLPVVTRSFVRRAHRAGVPVHVWTINDAARMHRLLDLGVDGLITDRTDVLKEVLVQRGQWRDPA